MEAGREAVAFLFTEVGDPAGAFGEGGGVGAFGHEENVGGVDAVSGGEAFVDLVDDLLDFVQVFGGGEDEFPLAFFDDVLLSPPPPAKVRRMGRLRRCFSWAWAKRPFSRSVGVELASFGEMEARSMALGGHSSSQRVPAVSTVMCLWWDLRAVMRGTSSLNIMGSPPVRTTLGVGWGRIWARIWSVERSGPSGFQEA